MAITKALADESRSRILLFLRGRELCVCQVVEMLGLAPSTVSKHLDILYQAGLIESRKDGRWVYYRLGERPSRAAKDAIGWLVAALAGDEHVIQDAKRLQAVLKMDKEKLCCRYGPKPKRCPPASPRLRRTLTPALSQGRGGREPPHFKGGRR